MIRCNYPTRFVPPAATRAPAAPNPFSMPRVRAGAASPFSKPRHSLATTWRQHLLASASSPRAAYTHKTPPRRVCAETPRTPHSRRPHAPPTPPLTYAPLPTPGRCPWAHGPQGPHAPPRPRREQQPMPRPSFWCVGGHSLVGLPRSLGAAELATFLGCVSLCVSLCVYHCVCVCSSARRSIVFVAALCQCHASSNTTPRPEHCVHQCRRPAHGVASTVSTSIFGTPKLCIN